MSGLWIQAEQTDHNVARTEQVDTTALVRLARDLHLDRCWPGRVLRHTNWVPTTVPGRAALRGASSPRPLKGSRAESWAPTGQPRPAARARPWARTGIMAPCGCPLRPCVTGQGSLLLQLQKPQSSHCVHTQLPSGKPHLHPAHEQRGLEDRGGASVTTTQGDLGPGSDRSRSRRWLCLADES